MGFTLIVHFYSELTLNPLSSVCIYFLLRSHVYMYTLVHYKSSQIKRNPRLYNFSRDCIFKIAQLCGKAVTLATLVRCVSLSHMSTYLSPTVALSLGHTRSLSQYSLHFCLAQCFTITQSLCPNVHTIHPICPK